MMQITAGTANTTITRIVPNETADDVSYSSPTRHVEGIEIL